MQAGRSAVLSLLLLILSAPLLAASPAWPQQRGTAGGEASIDWPGGGGIREWHFRGKGNRRYERGITPWASPAVAVIDGTPIAFAGGCDHILYALDLAAKEVRWTKIANGAILDAPVVGEVEGVPVVFWGASDRFVYAHIAGSGERLWTKELVPPTRTQAPARIMSPLFHEGVMYVTAFVYDKALPTYEQAATLFALDAGTGRQLWSRKTSAGPVGAPVGAVIDNRFVIFTAAQKGLLQAFAVSRDGAEFLWNYQMPHEVLGSPAILAGNDKPMLFLGSKFGDLISVDARTGKKLWRRMTGNWVDNNACIGTVRGMPVVFVGSHDYSVYALQADDGSLVWRRALAGEVYSAPSFFTMGGRSHVAVATLDNHLYVLEADSGRVVTSYFTGEPVWDKITKGETLWGSPVALAWGSGAALIHGSYNGYVYALPIKDDTSLRAKARSSRSLWLSLLAAGIFFSCIILPATLLVAGKSRQP